MINTQFIIDVTTSEETNELNLKYNRKDLVVPESNNEKLIVLMLESLIRSVLDNGFKPVEKKEEKNDETRNDNNDTELA